jgi:succinate dehydrogenase / fumarate reductase flavoprotein subunit
LVFGRRAGQCAAEFAKQHKEATIDKSQVESAAVAALKPFELGSSAENPYQIQYELQEFMQDLVGIVRTEEEMQTALTMIGQLRTKAERTGIPNHRQYNNGWHTAMDLPNLLDVSEAITRAALLRKESRGAQFREDYPGKDPEWGKYNIVVRRNADGGMLVEKRPVDPMPGELEKVIQEMK